MRSWLLRFSFATMAQREATQAIAWQRCATTQDGAVLQGQRISSMEIRLWSGRHDWRGILKRWMLVRNFLFLTETVQVVDISHTSKYQSTSCESYILCFLTPRISTILANSQA